MPSDADNYCLFENLNKKIAIFKVVQFLWLLLSSKIILYLNKSILTIISLVCWRIFCIVISYISNKAPIFFLKDSNLFQVKYETWNNNMEWPIITAYLWTKIWTVLSKTVISASSSP